MSNTAGYVPFGHGAGSRVASVALCAGLALGSSTAFAKPPSFSAGAAGAGDPYFPLDGNGGYDVEHYSLDLRYEPQLDHLAGVATIVALATQNLSSFDLDLAGLTVGSIDVDGHAAAWEHREGELIITPKRGLRAGARFSVVIEYGGVSETLAGDVGLPVSGFIHTNDGAVVMGEPHVAASWFPANDHPSDRASFTFEVTVPDGLEVVANGVLARRYSRQGWTTWVWNAERPMATYLAGMVIGELRLSSYEVNGIQYTDAIAASLFEPLTLAAPTTGLKHAAAEPVDRSYQRLSRVLSVPPEGASLSFSATVLTESDRDFFFVEAHGVGRDDWTTLPDGQGFATRDTGIVCASLQDMHPFLSHYQSRPAVENEPCLPSGDTGEWWAASGLRAPQTWAIDLSEWAGNDVEVSLSYVSDESGQGIGVFIDDIVLSTGVGSTSFEDDADVLDGWVSSAGPEGSPSTPGAWAVEPALLSASVLGENAVEALGRQPEIISLLEAIFGSYPFDVAGGSVPGYLVVFSLENQTRPTYSPSIFYSAETAASVVAHELAHQWFGDSLTVDSWQHIWLNEGFASYAQWLVSEREGSMSADESFNLAYATEANDPFWSVVIGDPGPEQLFAGAVYSRGAMTLHQLRIAVGDDVFFEILQEWASSRAGTTVTTDDFIALAEALSGQSLTDLFQTWLYVPAKPALVYQ
jgi:hypothetical protein